MVGRKINQGGYPVTGIIGPPGPPGPSGTLDPMTAITVTGITNNGSTQLGSSPADTTFVSGALQAAGLLSGTGLLLPYTSTMPFSGIGRTVSYGFAITPAAGSVADFTLWNAAQTTKLLYTAGDTLTLPTTTDLRYLPAGTGAVETTVQTKLRESVSVKDFGAVGNGVINDTTAFTLAAAVGSSVFIPSGVYLVNSATIAANLVFSSDAQINVASGQTLTLTDGVTASETQHIFTGTGLVVGLPVVYAKWFGATGDGVTNDYAALQRTFASWIASFRDIGAGSKKCVSKMRVTSGTYIIGQKIDLKPLFGAAAYYDVDFDMDASAVFAQSAVLNPMIDFSTTAGVGSGMAFCSLKFGGISGGLLGGTGVIFRGVSESKISFASANAFRDGTYGTNGTAIRFVCGSTAGVYNNIINIGAMLSNAVGILAQDTGTPPHGFQGNIVTIGHAAFCSSAIWLLNQSTSNTFHVGSMEGNEASAGVPGRGVLDQAGYNIYRVNFADNDAIELGTGNGRVDIEGYGFSILNTGASIGFVKNNESSTAAQIPAMPTSGVPYINNFMRPAMVTVSGGTGVSIYIYGSSSGSVATGMSSGTFSIPFGGNISIVYTTAPSWVWTFS